jgi:hypothetical protein
MTNQDVAQPASPDGPMRELLLHPTDPGRDASGVTGQLGSAGGVARVLSVVLARQLRANDVRSIAAFVARFKAAAPDGAAPYGRPMIEAIARAALGDPHMSAIVSTMEPTLLAVQREGMLRYLASEWPLSADEVDEVLAASRLEAVEAAPIESVAGIEQMRGRRRRLGFSRAKPTTAAGRYMVTMCRRDPVARERIKNELGNPGFGEKVRPLCRVLFKVAIRRLFDDISDIRCITSFVHTIGVTFGDKNLPPLSTEALIRDELGLPAFTEGPVLAHPNFVFLIKQLVIVGVCDVLRFDEQDVNELIVEAERILADSPSES